ncbi:MULTISPECIES: cold-shock protein [Paenibacillus]|uniref:Cold-shock protein n=3 Tax=Paenibacillus TaxID=44249 RepID=A0ABU3RLA1_9BACL|nr:MULTISPECIES: cold-shock protein [Paenibacillus]MBA2942777.1 cold-shock protein [Paenibacillus sp. CGMCC 1.16610]MCY9661927.1 cold-shock protein [Paenibacillus anseongense]MDU0205028.1 cold-shock protein [Paenibacillus sp. PFR10]MEB4793613.1 cold-shock protein [Paenibacillus chondroitinus]MEC0268745.1 cold-shock protein [Paenibacillus anseongense]
MYFSKKSMEPVPEEQTNIWTCSTEQCSCWMRDNFSFDESPECPICHSAMVKDSKMLPTLSNTSSRR